MENGNSSGPRLNLPQIQLRLAVAADDSVKVFDPLRDKFVTLTPEEYVRQHFVAYLTNQLHYPRSLLANEIRLDVNGCVRRPDTVAFSPEGEALLIVEYKAPGVKITQAVFDQIVRYNIKLRARYLAVTNGLNHYCCRIDYEGDTYHFIPSIPDYRSLRNTISDQ